MDVFLPLANAMLMEQVDKELPVRWSDLTQSCTTVNSLALELVRFFDVNIHWKHRELYEALEVIAGLKKVEDKNLNSLDLRLRTERFIEMKLKGEDYDTKRRLSRKAEKEVKIIDSMKQLQIQQQVLEEDNEDVERKKKRKSKKKRDHEKAARDEKRRSKHHESVKENGDVSREHERSKEKDGSRKKRSKREKVDHDEKNDEREMYVNGDVHREKPRKNESKSRKSVQKDSKERDIKERRKKDSSEKTGQDGKEINNNNVTMKSKAKLNGDDTNHVKHRSSYIPVEEWDPNSEEYLV